MLKLLLKMVHENKLDKTYGILLLKTILDRSAMESISSTSPIGVLLHRNFANILMSNQTVLMLVALLTFVALKTPDVTVAQFVTPQF